VIPSAAGTLFARPLRWTYPQAREHDRLSETPADFRILGPISQTEIIARGRGVSIRRFLARRYGGRNWRKLKGIARIEDAYGWTGEAEIHWFEAHGVGRVQWKIKKRLRG